VAEPLCSPHAHSVPTLPVFIRLTRGLILQISQPATSPSPPALRDLLPLHSHQVCATFYHSISLRSPQGIRASEPVSEPVIAEPLCSWYAHAAATLPGFIRLLDPAVEKEGQEDQQAEKIPIGILLLFASKIKWSAFMTKTMSPKQ
jgi:hypothetical protein